MRRLKWIVTGLFAVVVALLVAGYIVIANYDTEELRALIQDEVKSATGRELVIAGPINLAVSFTPRLVMEQVSLANVPGGKAANLASVARLEVEVALWPLLSGDIDIKRLVLVEPVFALERAADGTANWQMGEGEGAAPSFQEVSVERAAVTFEDIATGRQRRMTLETLEVSAPDLASPLSLIAKGQLDALPFDLTATLGSAQSLMSDQGFAMAAEGNIAGLKSQISGTVAPWDAGGNSFKVALTGPSATTLMATLALPLAPPGAFAFTADIIQPDADTLAFNGLSATLGESDLAGNATLELGGDHPRLAGAFASKKFLDSDLGLPASDDDEAGSLPLDFLQALDLDLTLTIGELQWESERLTDVQLPLRLEAGQLSAASFAANYLEGNFTGDFTLDSHLRPAKATLRAEGADINMAQLVGPELTGAAALSLDLSGEGDSLKALMASLDGRSTLSLGSGQLDSRFFSIMSASLGNVLLPLFDGSSTTAVNCAVVRVDWADGIGLSNGTVLDTANFTTTAAGHLSLRDETLDLYVDTVGKGVSLAAFAVPLRLTGPLDNPVAVPDPAGSAVTAAKIAGLIVFPPAGIAALIADQQVRSGNACTAAVEKVDQNGGPGSFFADLLSGAAEVIDDAVEGAVDVLEDTGDAIDDGIDSLFGK